MKLYIYIFIILQKIYIFNKNTKSAVYFMK